MPIEGITMTSVFSLVAVGIALALSSYIGGYYLKPIFEIDTLMASVAYDIAAIYDLAYTMPGEITVRYFGPNVCKWNYDQDPNSAKSFHCIDARTVLLKDVIINKEYLLLYGDPYLSYDSIHNSGSGILKAMGGSDISTAISSRKPTHLYIMIPYFNRQVKYQTDETNEQIFYGSLATAPIAASFTDIDILQPGQTPRSVTVNNWAFEVTKRRVGSYYYTLSDNPSQPEELSSFVDFAISAYNDICNQEEPADSYYAYTRQKSFEKFENYEDLFPAVAEAGEILQEYGDYFLKLYRATKWVAKNGNLSKLYDSWSFDSGLNSDIGKNELEFNSLNELNLTQGIHNNAYDFDGTNYIKKTDQVIFSQLGVSIWFKARDLGAEQTIFSIPGEFTLLIGTDNKLKVIKDGLIFISNQPIRKNIWYHAATNYYGNGTDFYLNLYINGEFEGFSQISSVSTIQGPGLQIGSPSFKGLIDDVKIFHTALNDVEVKQLYSSIPGNYLCQEELAYSNEISVVDKSIYFKHDFNNSEDYSGIEDFKVVENNVQNVTQGLRSAYSFPGTSFMEIGENYHFNTEAFSISLWFNSTHSLSNSYTILSKFYDLKGYVLYLTENDLNNNKYLTFLTSEGLNPDGSTRFYMAQGRTIINPNTWYNVAIVYDGMYNHLYLNGQLQASIKSEIEFTSSKKFNIGERVWSNGLNFTGLIDDLRVFQRALSIEEINQLYQDSDSLSNLFLNQAKINTYQERYCFDMNSLLYKKCENADKIILSENFIKIINEDTDYYASWNSCLKPFIFYDSANKAIILNASLSDYNMITGECTDE